jgi:hypothetical protein
LVEAGAEVIYEASFEYDGIFVKVDILVRSGEAWHLHEVKMGTSVKAVNHDDVAVQCYVLNHCGLEISRVFLVHIDNSYVRRGPVEVRRLFAAEDLTAAVRERQPGLPELIQRLREVLRRQEEPDIDIGPWCHNPYACDFIPWCWRQIPEESIFSLSGSWADKFALYAQGFVRLAEVPLERLREKQRCEALATLNRQDSARLDRVRTFLDTLWYPLCHLDFETFDTPIPPFDGTRPYQKIPFQFSLHCQRQAGTEPGHCAYLAAPNLDPRRELAERLLAELPEDACVLTYNQVFEKGVLQDLALSFPDLAPALEVRIGNLRDLMIPFRNRDVYRWPMHGSYSIKQVLPAMVPDMSYAGLEIAEGGAAMLAWHEMGATEDPARLAHIRRNLLEYCRLDTLAMVRILEALRELTAERGVAGEGQPR